MGGGSVETPQLVAQPSQPVAVPHICLCQLIQMLLQLLDLLPEVIQLRPLVWRKGVSSLFG